MAKLPGLYAALKLLAHKAGRSLAHATVKGRRAPLWKRSTVWAAADGRPGMGGGHRPGTPGAVAHQLPVAVSFHVLPCRVPSGVRIPKPAEIPASRVNDRPG